MDFRRPLLAFSSIGGAVARFQAWCRIPVLHIAPASIGIDSCMWTLGNASGVSLGHLLGNGLIDPSAAVSAITKHRLLEINILVDIQRRSELAEELQTLGLNMEPGSESISRRDVLNHLKHEGTTR